MSLIFSWKECTIYNAIWNCKHLYFQNYIFHGIQKSKLVKKKEILPLYCHSFFTLFDQSHSYFHLHILQITFLSVSGCKERDLWECPSSKQCLKHTVICDGFPGCPDNMDEKNCCKYLLGICQCDILF